MRLTTEGQYKSLNGFYKLGEAMCKPGTPSCSYLAVLFFAYD